MRRGKRPQKGWSITRVLFWLKWLSLGWLMGGVVIVVTAVVITRWLGKDLPDLEELSGLRLSQVTYIYSADGVLLGVAMSVYRKWVPLERIPKPLQWATLVAEDRRFYSHPGVDPKAILRALWECLKARSYVQGGSTITMQLARNLYLSPEKTIRRKLKELLLAVQLERRFSKDELLELYLNTVCYGHGAYGVQAAAELYFGKDVSDLTLPQCALLAALPRRPAELSPFVNPEGAKRRRDYILDTMAKLGYLSEGEAEAAKKVPVTKGLRPSPAWTMTRPKAFHFLEFIKKELMRRFGQDVVDRGGLKVYTTLHYALQREVERIAERYLRRYRRLGADQMAIVVLHILTGRILAMYGGRPYRVEPETGRKVLDHFNRATQAFRQPGSSFKPYIYAAALELGFKPQSVFNDRKITFVVDGRRWSPKNYDGIYGRSMTLKKALALSNNVIAVKLLHAVGIEHAIAVAKRMGVRFAYDPHRAGYTLALGSVGVTLLSHTAALASVARGGVWVEPTAIKKVYGDGNEPIYWLKPKTRRVLNPEVARQLLEMLYAVVTEGTGKRAKLPGYQVAGKTGTSAKIRDVWFIGFTPTIACGVWIGNEDFKPLRRGSGGTLAAPVFRDVMRVALKFYPGDRMFASLRQREETTPQRVSVTLCDETKLLATEFCPTTYTETIPMTKAPHQKCPDHAGPLYPTLICSASEELATPSCPPQAVTSRLIPQSKVPKTACQIHLHSPETSFSQGASSPTERHQEP